MKFRFSKWWQSKSTKFGITSRVVRPPNSCLTTPIVCGNMIAQPIYVVRSASPQTEHICTRITGSHLVKPCPQYVRIVRAGMCFLHRRHETVTRVETTHPLDYDKRLMKLKRPYNQLPFKWISSLLRFIPLTNHPCSTHIVCWIKWVVGFRNRFSEGYSELR